ncbi:B-box zinc finger protein (macronuclear) [Tetrahymena thermophila SB210]|uniref:B-box zinc finger protein n=1 Tax=Tetrahymena thermophila (strain SB210) TaxID=312017 RepID=Q23D10_TETTS|nr:B-box zinc finger protein [Tetrahymena thermophila SB210]EAR94479.2 B-box zinc finger protein [Tetrahymena thermophila SB210]|eukprot:XP_001014876.2 B-box zinc finger protein [Tetrahymena thermophila SB210]
MNNFCKIHRKEQIKFYCTDDFCIEEQRVMCDKCQKEKFHKTHKITNIENIQEILFENHSNINILKQEGLSQIEELCSKKIKKYLEIIEQTLIKWQKQKIQSSRNQIIKKFQFSKQILKKIQPCKVKKQHKLNQESSFEQYNGEEEEEKKCSGKDMYDYFEDVDSDDDRSESDSDSISDEDDMDQVNNNEVKYLQFSSEQNQFIMQAVRDKKQKISQKDQIEAILSQKFSDIEVQIQKLQKFISNKYSFSIKEFKGALRDQWNFEYVCDCPSILQFNDEQMLVIAAENNILLQNLNEQVTEEIAEAHELSIVALEKINENMFVSGSYDGMIKSWCPRTGQRLPYRNSFHISGVSCLKKLDKFHLISGDGIGNVVISDVKNSKIIRIMRNPYTSDMSLLCCIEVMKPQRLIITGSKKGIIDFWDYSKGEIIRQIKMHQAISNFFMPTSFLLMVGQVDGQITCWDCRTGIKVKSYEQDSNLGVIKRLGPDTFVASYQNKKIKFFNFMQQKPFKQIEHDEEIIGILPLYKNNQLATIDACNELALWC